MDPCEREFERGTFQAGVLLASTGVRRQGLFRTTSLEEARIPAGYTKIGGARIHKYS